MGEIQGQQRGARCLVDDLKRHLDVLCTFDRFARLTDHAVLSADRAMLLVDRPIVHQSVDRAAINWSYNERPNVGS